MRFFDTLLLFLISTNLIAQISLPTFHGIQKPTSTVPFLNYALDFDGTGDYITINGSDMNLPWTVEVWFERAANNNGALLLWRCGSGCWSLKLEQWNNTHKLGITKFGTTDWSWNYITSIGKWEHIAWVAQNNIVELFVNGVSQGTKSLSNPKLYWKYIGRSNGNLTIDGKIDELRIWNDARTVTEIKSNIFKELDGNEANLTAYYKMSDGSGTTLTDNSTNSYNGTMTYMNDTDWVDSYAPIGSLSDSYETDSEGLWRMTGTNTSQPSNGLSLEVGSMLSEENFIVFGNNNTSSTSTSDLPVGVVVRSERIWQMDETGTVNADITFDISDVTGNNVTVGASSNYKLLYRAGTSGNFSTLATANSVSGDNITFSNIDLGDGYYCLGATANGNI